MGLTVRVFSERRLRPNWDPPRADCELWSRTVLPGRLNAVPVFRSYNDSRIEEVVAAWCADEADLHVYMGPPHPLRRPAAGYPRCLVYDCIDDWEAFRGTQRTPVLDLEREICRHARQVWASSRVLKTRLESIGVNVTLVPNAGDYRHFSVAAALRHARARNRPVLGYVGALASWFDAELVREVAALLPHLDIVLVGPQYLEHRQRRLLRMRNITFQGRVAYRDLPYVMASFDIAMIPFLINRLTQSTNPIKAYEYLAAGLPFVATPLPDLLPLVEPGCIVCAADPQSFATAVQSLLSSPETGRCQEIARRHTWSHRFAPLLRNLLSAMAPAPFISPDEVCRPVRDI
jgi:glycosyltransferase involved in cell wall biosynthesis